MDAASLRRRRVVVGGFAVSAVAQIALIVVGVAFLVSTESAVSSALLFAWCAIGTAYVAGVWATLALASRFAESDEPPLVLELRLAPRALSFLATVLVSLVGVAATLQHIFVGRQEQLDVVGVWAMILAWMLLHWGFAQRYLQLYYREEKPPLAFPSTAAPGILEFAYFSYTVAVSLAASDVAVLERRMRWRVLVHAVISFFFNGLIIVTAFGAIAEAGAF